MHSNKIYIVPDGGLANRFRAMVSGIYLAQVTQREPIIIWHSDNLCNVSLSDILQVESIPADIMVPNEMCYRVVYESPRKKNLFLPRIFAPLKFKKRYYDATNLMPYCDNIEALRAEVEVTNGDVLLFSGQEFYDFPRELFREIIKPSDSVLQRAEEILGGQNPKTCFQIRRTDHSTAIEQSPLELFLDKMEEISGQTFFLATDDELVKSEVKKRFGDNVIFNEHPAIRSSREGIIDAMAEIVIMSKCDVIYGSAGSSFPDAASWMGDNRLIRLQR